MAIMSLESFTPGWKPVHVGVEGDDVCVQGLTLWQFKWQSISAEPITVPHPSYLNQRHEAMIYAVESQRSTIYFAAAELSPGVWGFYVPS
jgi:hypothetical protein